MRATDVEDIYTLSPIQSGILFHALSSPESRVFLEQGIATLRGGLDPAAFVDAWREVIARHPVLRSSFLWKSVSKPLQVVHREVPVPLARFDWREAGAQERSERLHALVAGERASGVCLDAPPLMRMVLVQTGEREYEFVWTIHHLVHDSWSTSILLRELFQIYDSILARRPHSLAPARPYRDYVRWMKQQDYTDAKAFWKQYLQDFRQPAALPESMRFTSTYTGEPHDRRERIVPENETRRILEFARSARLTLSTTIQGIWALRLARRASSAVVFGRVVSGRPPGLAGIEGIVGPFINTLPTRVPIIASQPAVDWLRQIQATQAAETRYDHTPLALIRRWSTLPAGEPLFHSIVVFQSTFSDPAGMAVGEIEISNLRYEGYPNDPVMLRVWPGRTLRLELSYARSLCQAAAADQILGALHHCLGALIEGEPTVGELMDRLDKLHDQIRTDTTEQRRQSIAAKLQALSTNEPGGAGDSPAHVVTSRSGQANRLPHQA